MVWCNPRSSNGTVLYSHTAPKKILRKDVEKSVLDFSYGLRLEWGTFRWPQPPRFSQKYCDTNGRHNANGRRTAIQMGGVLTIFPFPQSVGAPKALQYKLEVYCNTNWRCIAILFWEVLGTKKEKKMLAWPPLQSPAVKKNFFLCKFWAVKNF